MSAKLSVIVCRGPSCSLHDSAALVRWCEELAAAHLPITHDISPCTGNCHEAPVVEWNGVYLTEATPERLTSQLIAEDLL